jgi:hypothetical protein
MKTILLTQGYFALVDDEDYDYLMQWSWYVHKSDGLYYAARQYQINNKKYTVFMHQIILERMVIRIPYGYLPDHIDRNGLNNQRYNLKISTFSESGHNRNLQINNISGMVGVRPWFDKWRAEIQYKKEPKSLGYHDTWEAAVWARLQGEKIYLKRNQGHTILDFGLYKNKNLNQIITSKEGIAYLKELLNQENLDEVIKLKIKFYFKETGIQV